MEHIRIEALRHGDKRMWALLGPYMASREVHKELGSPIYSSESMSWLVALDRSGLVGFASLREGKDLVWYDYAYVRPDRRGEGVFSLLADERDKRAVAMASQLRAVIREDRWHHYEARGWTITSARGSWRNISREVVQ